MVVHDAVDRAAHGCKAQLEPPGVFERRLGPFARDAAARAPDQQRYAFNFCDVVMKRYCDDEAYYRVLMSGMGASLDSLLAAIANWQLVVLVAIQQGDLRADTPVSSVAETIEYGIAGTMAFWSSAAFRSERLEPQTRFAVASTLFMFATPSALPRLQRIVKSATRALKALGPLG